MKTMKTAVSLLALAAVLAAPIALAAQARDDSPDLHDQSMAPPPPPPKRTYGAPIQAPILHRVHRTRPSATTHGSHSKPNPGSKATTHKPQSAKSSSAASHAQARNTSTKSDAAR
jgi:hypothetical protein